MTIIHVNRNLINQNKKNGTTQPVLTVREGKSTIYCNRTDILDKDGNKVATILYSPDSPLKCGARVWIETIYPAVTDICLTSKDVFIR